MREIRIKNGKRMEKIMEVVGKTGATIRKEGEWYGGARADIYCLDETLNAMDRMMMIAVLSGCGGAIEDLGQRAFKRDILVHLFL